jgi:hypothetical protein
VELTSETAKNAENTANTANALSFSFSSANFGDVDLGREGGEHMGINSEMCSLL